MEDTGNSCRRTRKEEVRLLIKGQARAAKRHQDGWNQLSGAHLSITVVKTSYLVPQSILSCLHRGLETPKESWCQRGIGDLALERNRFATGCLCCIKHSDKQLLRGMEGGYKSIARMAAVQFVSPRRVRLISACPRKHVKWSFHSGTQCISLSLQIHTIYTDWKSIHRAREVLRVYLQLQKSQTMSPHYNYERDIYHWLASGS